eukprot:CAMPEP_0119033710 /NCGR_PEP_ID=MMETSP1177-20130426/761_1 /TAXON_ID=2985 /ORGANISM="Ochromonas sp, Strain CCMP1899" /LENGTH=461 /DNA_ID=CAMNT_0006990655 /DNA_START=103 /DNA_END=1489 /DNA_ORIENTATION=+
MKSNGKGTHTNKKREIEAPVCLGDLFAESDDEADDQTFSQLYEVQDLDIGGKKFKIRQFAWHGANANKVWPGTFNLAEYICLNKDTYIRWPILELGAATGALSIYLSSEPFKFNIFTSDIDDGGEVEENISHNFKLNSVSSTLHIPHTWGTGWHDSLSRAHEGGHTFNNEGGTGGHECSTSSGSPSRPPIFKYIFASDILLYVSAYPALVQTLCEIFNLKSAVVFEDEELNDTGGHNDERIEGLVIADMVAVGDIDIDSRIPNIVQNEVASVCIESNPPVFTNEMDSIVHEDNEGPEGAIDMIAEAVAVCTESCGEIAVGDVIVADICDSNEDYEMDNLDRDRGDGSVGRVMDEVEAITEAELIATVQSIIPIPALDTEDPMIPAGIPEYTLESIGTTGTPSLNMKNELFYENETDENRDVPVEFLMSWNRRIAESAIFFDLMNEAGFQCEHKGNVFIPLQ